MLTNNQAPNMRIVDDLSSNVAAILSQEAQLFTANFYNDLNNHYKTAVNVPLQIEHRGKINAVLVFFRAQLDDAIQLSNTPYNAHTHWGWALHDLPAEYPVEPGDQIDIRAQITTVDGRERVLISTNKMDALGQEVYATNAGLAHA